MLKIKAFLLTFGPWGVLLLSVIDSAGIPVPGGVDFLVITVAASSVRNPGYAYFTALVAVLGSLAGNIMLFLAVRHGRRLFSRKAETVPGKFQLWFRRYGLLTVFVPAVTPIVPLPLKVFVISAAIFHSPFSRFLSVIVIARVIRYFGEAWLGIQLGEDAKGFLIRNGWTLCGVALALTFVLYFLMRINDRRRSVEQVPDLTGE